MNNMACPPNTLYLCVQDPQSDYVATQLSDHGLWGKFKVVYIYSVLCKAGNYIPLDEQDVPISVPPIIIGTPSFLVFVNNQASVLKGTGAILSYFKLSGPGGGEPGPGAGSDAGSGVSAAPGFIKPLLTRSDGDLDATPVRFPTTPVVIHDNPSALNSSYTPIVPGVNYTKNANNTVQLPPHAAHTAPIGQEGQGSSTASSGMLVESAAELKKNELAQRLQEFKERLEQPLTYGNG